MPFKLIHKNDLQLAKPIATQFDGAMRKRL
jgi:hypothetical protein